MANIGDPFSGASHAVVLANSAFNTIQILSYNPSSAPNYPSSPDTLYFTLSNLVYNPNTKYIDVQIDPANGFQAPNPSFPVKSLVGGGIEVTGSDVFGS